MFLCPLNFDLVGNYLPAPCSRLSVRSWKKDLAGHAGGQASPKKASAFVRVSPWLIYEKSPHLPNGGMSFLKKLILWSRNLPVNPTVHLASSAPSFVLNSLIIWCEASCASGSVSAIIGIQIQFLQIEAIKNKFYKKIFIQNTFWMALTNPMQ